MLITLLVVQELTMNFIRSIMDLNWPPALPALPALSGFAVIIAAFIKRRGDWLNGRQNFRENKSIAKDHSDHELKEIEIKYQKECQQEERRVGKAKLRKLIESYQQDIEDDRVSISELINNQMYFLILEVSENASRDWLLETSNIVRSNKMCSRLTCPSNLMHTVKSKEAEISLRNQLKREVAKIEFKCFLKNRI